MTIKKTALTRGNRAALLLGSVLASAALMPTAGLAQTQSTAAIVDEADQRMIVVTARQREENIQDIPLAITAFDAKDIANKNIENLDDVARFTAGLAFEDGQGGFAFPTIRGVSQLFTTAREQPTAVFMNGVYLPRSWLVDLGIKDLARIEVVKGPQSARYGRNAFAGAINYVSQTADLDEMRVRLDATVGTFDRFDGGAAISMPVIPGMLAVRVSYDHTQSDGTWENTHPNNGLITGPATEGNVGGWNREAYSANVVFKPTEGLTISGRYNGFEIADEATPTYWLGSESGQGNCGTNFDYGGAFPGFGGPRLFCGEFGVINDTVEMDPRAYGRRVKADVFSLDVNWEVTDEVTLSYLFGKVKGRTDGAYTTENDQVNCGALFNANGPTSFLGTLCNFQGGLTGTLDYDSHELRANYKAGAIDISVGGFYVKGDDNPQAISINIAPLGRTSQRTDAVNSVPFSNLIFGNNLTVTEIKAVFGELRYEFPDGRTRVSGEVRYTSEELTTTNLRSATALILNKTFNFVTPRFTIEHDINDTTLLYATVARGAKAGGFNAGAFNPALRTYEPEFNWTYEVGAKTNLGGIATVNLAAYLTKWSGMQVTASDPDDPGDFSQVLIRNLGNATLYGVELEAAVYATENITLDGTLSYSKSTFDAGTNDLQYVAFRFGFPPACDGIVCDPATGDIGGNNLPRTPQFMASFGAEYRAKYNSKGDEYFLRGDVSYQDGFFADTINQASSPSRVLTNLRAGVDFGNFNVAVWARNLFDKKYVTTSTSIVQSGGTNLFGAYYGERRTLGATASYNF